MSRVFDCPYNVGFSSLCLDLFVVLVSLASDLSAM